MPGADYSRDGSNCRTGSSGHSDDVADTSPNSTISRFNPLAPGWLECLPGCSYSVIMSAIDRPNYPSRNILCMARYQEAMSLHDLESQAQIRE